MPRYLDDPSVYPSRRRRRDPASAGSLRRSRGRSTPEAPRRCVECEYLTDDELLDDEGVCADCRTRAERPAIEEATGVAAPVEAYTVSRCQICDELRELDAAELCSECSSRYSVVTLPEWAEDSAVDLRDDEGGEK